MADNQIIEQGKRLKAIGEYLGLNQTKFADLLGITQSNLSYIQGGKRNISSQILAIITDNHKWINIDWLLNGRGEMLYSNGTTKSTTRKSNNIFVPIAAQAGYMEGYGQEFVSQELVYVNIPGVEGEARTFEIDGDSMAPVLMHGDFVVCRRVEGPESIKNRNIYVIVAPVAGIVAKYIESYKDGLHLISENKALFKPIVCPYEEVKEIWEVSLRITNHLIHPRYYADNDSIQERLRKLEEMMALKRPLKED